MSTQEGDRVSDRAISAQDVVDILTARYRRLDEQVRSEQRRLIAIVHDLQCLAPLSGEPLDTDTLTSMADSTARLGQALTVVRGFAARLDTLDAELQVAREGAGLPRQASNHDAEAPWDTAPPEEPRGPRVVWPPRGRRGH